MRWFAFPKGGDRHEVALVVVLLGLSLLLSAPCLAADAHLTGLQIGAIPPPTCYGPCSVARPPIVLAAGTERIRVREDAADDGPAADEPRGVTLTPEEYTEFKNLTVISKATPLQVGAINIAVKGTAVLIIGLAWLAFLWILRRTWDRWFDEDVYKNGWASVAVIITLLACTAWILVSVVA